MDADGCGRTLTTRREREEAEVWSYKAENKSIYVVFRVDFEFDVRLCVDTQKPRKNCEKRDVLMIMFFGESARRFFVNRETVRQFFF